MLDLMTLPSNCWHPSVPRTNSKAERTNAVRKPSPVSQMSHETSTAMSRRHKVTVACASCKSRKSRCSGTSPCEACMTLNTECVIDETQDGRRKVALNRRLEELVHHKWILEGLLLSLRTSRHGPLLNILDLVNCEAPLPVLAASISDALLKSPELGAQGGMHPFFMDRDNRRGSHVSGRSRNKATESWNSSTSEYVDHISLSQNLDEYARQNPVTPPSGPPRKHPTMGSNGNYAPIQRVLFDTELGYGYPYETSRRQNHNKIAPQDSGLQDVVVWLKNVTLNDDARQHYPGVPCREFPQGPWHPVIGEEVAPIPTPRLSPEHGAVLSNPEYVRSGDTRKKRPLSSMIVPNRPSPNSSFSGSASSTVSIPASAGPLLDAVSISTPSSATMSFAPDCPWNLLPGPSSLALMRPEPDDAPIPRAIASYLNLGRNMLAEGVPTSTIFGPDRPLLDLYFRERAEGDAHSVCNFAAELIGNVKGLESPAGLAMAHMFTYLMRWMILSSPENFSKIPELYRPTFAQTTVPHSSVVEFCPLPELRNALCQRPRDFIGSLATNLSCNWPYDASTCVETDPQTGSTYLSDTFRSHIETPENWTCRPEIFKTFPECVNAIRTFV